MDKRRIVKFFRWKGEGILGKGNMNKASGMGVD